MLLLGTRRNYNHLVHSSELAPGRRGLSGCLLGLVGNMEGACAAALEERLEFRGDLCRLLRLQEVAAVERHAPRAVGPLAELVEEPADVPRLRGLASELGEGF